MKVSLTHQATGEAFLDGAQPWLMRAEAENNLILGMAAGTPNGIRVNFVYTPEATRRRGYATGCVATLTQMLMDRGNRYCALYADLANPTSNAIYRRIGYEHLCDAAEYVLS